MSVAWLLTSIVLAVFAAVALVIAFTPGIRNYFSTPEGMGQIVIAIVGVAITVLGIAWAFHAESNRTRTIEENIYKRTFVALLSETGSNLAIINSIKRTTKSDQFSSLTLSTDIVRSMMENPLTYKYTGEDYLLALMSNVVRVDVANRWISFVMEDLKADGKISDENVQSLMGQLDECKYYSLILQIQTQQFIHGYDVKYGPKSPNADVIKAWLRREPRATFEELEAKLKEMGGLSPDEIEGLRQGLQGAVKD